MPIKFIGGTKIKINIMKNRDETKIVTIEQNFDKSYKI